MKYKSLALNIIAGAIIVGANISGLLGPIGTIVAALIVQALTMLMKQFAPTGVWITGWNWVFWVTNIGTFIIALLGLIGASGLVISTSLAELFAKVIIIINALLMAISAMAERNATTPATP